MTKTVIQSSFPPGKSPICVLHEYVQHVLKIAPEYVYRELENPQEPYSCTVILKGVEYGSGTGSSKKTAKLQAAKATMKVLIPHLYEKVREDGEEEEEVVRACLCACTRCMEMGWLPCVHNV